MSNIKVDLEDIPDEKVEKAITQTKELLQNNIKAYKHLKNKNTLNYVDKDVMEAKYRIYKSILFGLEA